MAARKLGSAMAGYVSIPAAEMCGGCWELPVAPGRPVSIKIILFGCEAALSLQLHVVASVRPQPSAVR